MINVRRSKPFKVVSVLEPGMMKLPRAVFQKYSLSRDFDSLPFDTIDPRPSVLTCQPLDADFDYLTDERIDTNMARAVFARHVTKAENLLDDGGRAILVWEDDGNRRVVTMDSIKKLPRDFVQEVAGVIVQMANIDTRPFFALDTSQEIVRSRVLASLAEPVSTETASEPPSKSDVE